MLRRTQARWRKAGGLLSLFGLVLTMAFVSPSPQRAEAYAHNPPSGVTASQKASKAIALTWKAISGVKAYRVQFSTSSSMKSPKTLDVVGNYVEWTRTNSDPKVSSTRLKPNTPYYFRVRAIAMDKSNLSGYSKMLKVVTAKSSSLPELAPVQLKATVAGPTSLYLSWRSRGPGVAYRVRYGTSADLPDASSKTADFPVAGGELKGLTKGTKYYVKVRVIDADGNNLSNYSAVSQTPAPADIDAGLTVATYNVLKTGTSPSWSSRREALADNIMAVKPDILNLQEAETTRVVDNNGNSVPQYQDLLGLLSDNYKAVGGSSAGVRMFYNSSRLSVVDSGVLKLPSVTTQKYAVWAILKDKDSGKKVFAVDTHLEVIQDSGGGTTYWQLRVDEAKAITDTIDAENKDNLPVIVAGDMNSNQSASPSNGPYGVFSKYGLLDPFGNTDKSWAPASWAPAEHRIDPEYNSYNNFERTARRSKYYNGYDVDYIFASSSVRVALVRTVVTVDANRQFIGTIPSDHNMIEVVVHLP